MKEIKRSGLGELLNLNPFELFTIYYPCDADSIFFLDDTGHILYAHNHIRVDIDTLYDILNNSSNIHNTGIKLEQKLSTAERGILELAVQFDPEAKIIKHFENIVIKRTATNINSNSDEDTIIMKIINCVPELFEFLKLHRTYRCKILLEMSK